VLWWLRYSTCSPHKSPPGPHFFGFAGTIVQANLLTDQRHHVGRVAKMWPLFLGSPAREVVDETLRPTDPPWAFFFSARSSASKS
jgi:hypothetical protein